MGAVCRFLSKAADRGAGYGADNLDTISEQELMEFLNFSADYAALTIGKMGAAMASMEEMERVYGK